MFDKRIFRILSRVFSIIPKVFLMRFGLLVKISHVLMDLANEEFSYMPILNTVCFLPSKGFFVHNNLNESL